MTDPADATEPKVAFPAVPTDIDPEEKELYKVVIGFDITLFSHCHSYNGSLAGHGAPE